MRNFFLLLVCLAVSKCIAQSIYTCAGTGNNSFSGDNGPAVSASISLSFAAATDKYGNLYIADSQNHRIRKITPAGIITTIAGTGTAGYSGNNGPAITAQLNAPEGVAVDTAGNIYVADTYNHRIRKIKTNGTIVNFAGNGTGGNSGDGGLAVNANLFEPSGVIVDKTGTVYFCMRSLNRVRQVAPNGIITTYAGSGATGYSGDGGQATNANLNYPTGLAKDKLGNLFIVDEQNNCIRKVNTAGVISTYAGSINGGFAGDGAAASTAKFLGPSGVAIDTNGYVYIADRGNYRIRCIKNGIIHTIAGNGTAGYAGDGGAATSAELMLPYTLAIDGANNIYIIDQYNYRIRCLDPVMNVPIRQENTMELFPNPSGTGVFYIRNLQPADQLSIYNSCGQQINYTRTHDSSGERFHLELPGIYFADIRREGQGLRLKIVVTKE